MTDKIAILATGDELINGDVQNTNSHQIAHYLFSYGLQPGFHMGVSDAELDISQAITFLLQHHNILIITGGLGPTSDDRTRFALANTLNCELIFNENCWQHILERYKDLDLPIVESNRQQALFPKDAKILPNPHGTACGCYYQTANHSIFLLPGPPHECLTMFNDYVLPELTNRYASDLTQLKWKLFGVSEGEIGEQLDSLLKSYPCQIGYRWDYPYIDFKITVAKDYAQIKQLQQLVDDNIAQHIICPPDETAIKVLQQWLLKTRQKCVIDDQATGGLLEANLKIPELSPFLIFNNEALPNAYYFKLRGLTHYWQQAPDKTTDLVISYYAKRIKQLISKNYTLPFRSNKHIRSYAVEFIAYLMYQQLTADSKI